MGLGPVSLTVFIPMFGMITVFVLNSMLAHQRTRQQIGRDARGVRAALLAELMLLRELIADNLRLIRQGEEYVLSFRVLTQVYRSNVGRLNLLAEAEIDAVVSAYGTTEATEVFMGATTKPHGAHAYRIWLGDESWSGIGHRLHTAQAAVETAIVQLGRTRQDRVLEPSYRNRLGLNPWSSSSAPSTSI